MMPVQIQIPTLPHLETFVNGYKYRLQDILFSLLFQTHDNQDKFIIRVGTGESSPILKELYGKDHEVPLTIDVTTEFLWMQWSTNNKDVKKGIVGTVKRLD